MKRTQNEKILQIKNETLIVGVDIAKKIHHARAFDNRGVELGKLLKFENSAQGFAAFDAWLAKIQQKHGMTVSGQFKMDIKGVRTFFWT